jgi:putative flippase GtrA
MPFFNRLRSSRRFRGLADSPLIAKIAKYAIGSVVALLTSVIVFAILYVTNIGTTACSVIAFIAGAIPNWVLNRKWAWKMDDRVDVAREVIGYTVVSILALIAASAGTGWAQHEVIKLGVAAHHGYRVILVTGAYVAVQALLFAVKYVIYDRWVFTGRSRVRAAIRARRDLWAAGRPERSPVQPEQIG